jgi:metal-responsive CopG/Arc/MetJ family transcriptional regulator
MATTKKTVKKIVLVRLSAWVSGKELKNLDKVAKKNKVSRSQFVRSLVQALQ